MKIKIYQVGEKQRELMFSDYKTAKEKGLHFIDYKLVYECERPSDYNTEDVYEEFNINRPEDFKGHSLSISDIVEFDETKLYCDKIGWVNVDKDFESIDFLTPPYAFLKRYSPENYEKCEETMKKLLECNEGQLQEKSEKFFARLVEAINTDEEPAENSFSRIIARYLNGSERDKAVIDQTFTDICGYGIISLIEFIS